MLSAANRKTKDKLDFFMRLGCTPDHEYTMKASMFGLSLWKCLNPTVGMRCPKHRVRTGLVPFVARELACQRPARQKHKLTDHIYRQSCRDRTVY